MKSFKALLKDLPAVRGSASVG
uniref:Uncharacterized protein n=1 Tax=Moniliophthora roreri TaxID=221103 RepID=A0A0W0FFE8_MONRR